MKFKNTENPALHLHETAGGLPPCAKQGAVIHTSRKPLRMEAVVGAIGMIDCRFPDDPAKTVADLQTKFGQGSTQLAIRN